MMRFSPIVLAIVLASSAGAQTLQDLNLCGGITHPDESIKSCTAILETGDTILGTQRPLFLTFRAAAFYTKGFYRNAIYDTSLVPAINKQDVSFLRADEPPVKAEPLAIYLRGLARLKVGDSGGNDDISAARAKLPTVADYVEKHWQIKP
jgi:hypothetical protein